MLKKYVLVVAFTIFGVANCFDGVGWKWEYPQLECLDKEGLVGALKNELNKSIFRRDVVKVGAIKYELATRYGVSVGRVSADERGTIRNMNKWIAGLDKPNGCSVEEFEAWDEQCFRKAIIEAEKKRETINSSAGGM